MAMRKIENKDLITCRGAHVEEFKCVGVKGINEFSNSWSYLNVVDKKIKGKDGKFTNVKKLPYCKSCNTIAYQKYRDEKFTPEEALYFVCSMNNIPFIAEKVQSTFDYITSEAKRGAKVTNIFGTYYSTLAKETSKHHLWQDFSCTDIDYKDIATHIEKRDVTKKEMERFELDWGKQSEIEDYEFLEYRYDVYTNGVALTPSQESLYRKLCRYELDSRKKEEKNESTNDETKQILELMKRLKIDNFNEQKDKSETDRIIEKQIWEIENTEPCELEDKKIYNDVLDLGQNWGKHILRAMKNLVAGTKDYPNVTKDEWN